MPDAAFGVCLRFVFRFPYGLYGMGIFLAAIVLLVVAIMHMGAGGDGQYDKTRNLTYSHKGTYGTAGFLNPKEAGQVLDFVPDLRKHHGTILGEVFYCRRAGHGGSLSVRLGYDGFFCTIAGCKCKCVCRCCDNIHVIIVFFMAVVCFG